MLFAFKADSKCCWSIADLESDFWATVHAAAKHGLDKLLTRLLERPDSRNNKFEAAIALKIAIENGHDKIVDLSLDFNPELANVTTGDQETALHHAARLGNLPTLKVRIAEKLLALSPSLIDKVTLWQKETALHIAARYGKETVVAQLLAHSPQAGNVVNRNGATAFRMAILGGHGNVVTTLLNAKSHDEWAVRDLIGALWLALEKGMDRVDVVAHLLAYRPELIDERGDDGWNILEHAAYKEHEGLVEFLLLTKPEMATKMRDSDGNTLLHQILHVNGNRNEDGYLQNYFSEAFCKRVFRMNPRALHSLNKAKDSAFHEGAKRRSSDTLRMFCMYMSVEQITKEFDRLDLECQVDLEQLWPEVKKTQFEGLAGVLPPELFDIVCSYVFPPKRTRCERVEAGCVFFV